MTTAKPPLPERDNTACHHDWREGYYGWKCAKCGQFVAHGAEPWLVLTEEQEYQLAKEEYEQNHGTCEVCNGEWGDGWSTCDSREWPDDDWGLEER